MNTQWFSFDENFDINNGGALYLANVAEGCYQVAGVLWMDGGDKEYFAFVAEFENGHESDYGVVREIYDAADAFNGAVDGDVVREIGWFDNMEKAVEAVNRFCGC